MAELERERNGAAPLKPARLAWDALYERRALPWGGAVALPEVRARGRVLELGCGGGRLLIPLSRELARRGEEGPIVVGLDFSIRALEALRARAPGALVCGDALRLPFRDGSFGLVLCRHLLEHMSEEGRRAAARELLRVLAAGGWGYVTVFSVRDARFGRGAEAERGTFLRGDGILHHYFDAGELRLLFGASLVSCREVGWTERAGRGKLERAVLEAELEGRRA
ncbi:MAG: class I SAM-dependent methyltransferase [Thermoplasmatota archaeon]